MGDRVRVYVAFPLRAFTENVEGDERPLRAGFLTREFDDAGQAERWLQACESFLQAWYEAENPHLKGKATGIRSRMEVVHGGHENGAGSYWPMDESVLSLRTRKAERFELSEGTAGRDSEEASGKPFIC